MLNLPIENLIEQRLNELAAAQTAQMRMRIQTEMKIRRELRPEQLATCDSCDFRPETSWAPNARQHVTNALLVETPSVQ